jgi:hypothetical protein
MRTGSYQGSYLWAGTVLIAAALASRPASALVLGQTDDFQDGTTQGWLVPGPSPNPPVNVPTGGPAGADDAYLSLVASGTGGAGSKLSVLNQAQWTGDYASTGATAIRMQVRNFGPADLSLRLLFQGATDVAFSADPVAVPAGSDWTEISFPIGPADLIAASGTAEGALAGTQVIRIFHNPEAFPPSPVMSIPSVDVTLGVDDITLAPEPAAAWLSTTAVAALWLGGRRRSRRASLRPRLRREAPGRTP